MEGKVLKRKTSSICLGAILILLAGIFLAQSLLWGMLGGLMINFYAEKMSNKKESNKFYLPPCFSIH